MNFALRNTSFTLQHAVNFTTWVDGFTSSPKEGVLQVFIAPAKSIALSRV
jgi:hypothetical protein